MKLIKKETFFNSKTDSYLCEIEIILDNCFYKVLHESSDNIIGRLFVTKTGALDYFEQSKKNIIKFYQSQEIIYTIK